MPLLCCDVGLVSELRLTAGCVLMDLASPAVSRTSVHANGLTKETVMETILMCCRQDVSPMTTTSTYSQAQEDKEMLTELLDDSDTGNGVFNALTEIKGNLRHLKVKHMKRTTISNHLCQKQSHW